MFPGGFVRRGSSTPFDRAGSAVSYESEISVQGKEFGMKKTSVAVVAVALGMTTMSGFLSEPAECQPAPGPGTWLATSKIEMQGGNAVLIAGKIQVPNGMVATGLILQSEFRMGEHPRSAFETVKWGWHICTQYPGDSSPKMAYFYEYVNPIGAAPHEWESRPLVNVVLGPGFYYLQADGPPGTEVKLRYTMVPGPPPMPTPRYDLDCVENARSVPAVAVHAGQSEDCYRLQSNWENQTMHNGETLPAGSSEFIMCVDWDACVIRSNENVDSSNPWTWQNADIEKCVSRRVLRFRQFLSSSSDASDYWSDVDLTFNGETVSGSFRDINGIKGTVEGSLEP
jgi:hypothetical protein